MNKIITLCFLTLFYLGFSSCEEENLAIKGEGPPVTEMRPLNNFSKISTAINAEIYLSQGPQEEIKL